MLLKTLPYLKICKKNSAEAFVGFSLDLHSFQKICKTLRTWWEFLLLQIKDNVVQRRTNYNIQDNIVQRLINYNIQDNVVQRRTNYNIRKI